MSQFILACYRTGSSGSEGSLAESVTRIEARLRPPGLESRLKVFCSEGNILIAASLFHSPGVAIESGSAAFGALEARTDGWARPGSAIPEGSFALVRTSMESVELISDAMATRSIWYFADQNRLLAASSERALLMLMGDFQPKDAAGSWMLANGVRGPHSAWDQRVRQLGPESRLMLDRRTWRLDLHCPVIDFSPAGSERRDWMGDYRRGTKAAVRGVADWPGEWILPLSGGYDSRILACLLKGKRKWTTVTWGMGKGAFSTQLEATAAKALADWAGFSHKYEDVGDTLVPFSTAVRRFVAINEARTDHIAAYRDGFSLWRRLVEQGLDCAALGDEPFGGFGWAPVHDERQVRSGLGLSLPREIPGLQGLDLPEIVFPEELKRRKDEDLLTWRYRLFHDFRIPVVRAAQNETKARYLNIANPHQFHSVVRLVRRLPHELRTDKKLLIDFARELSPPVPFCSAREGDQLLDQLQSAEAREFLNDELYSQPAIGLWGSTNIKTVLARLNERSESTLRPDSRLTYLKRAVRNYLPRSVKRRIARYMPVPPVPAARLAFRMWQVVEIDRVMREDVRVAKGLRG